MNFSVAVMLTKRNNSTIREITFLKYEFILKVISRIVETIFSKKKTSALFFIIFITTFAINISVRIILYFSLHRSILKKHHVLNNSIRRIRHLPINFIILII